MTETTTYGPAASDGDGYDDDDDEFKKMPRRWPFILGIVVAGGLGFGAGVDSEPEPEIRTVTETEQVEVEVAHPACLRALDNADEGFSLAGEFAGYAQDAISAATILDARAALATVGEMDALNEKLNPVLEDYVTAKAECREQRP